MSSPTKKEQAQGLGYSIYRYDKDVESRCYFMLVYPDGEYSHIERKTEAEAWEDFDPSEIQGQGEAIKTPAPADGPRMDRRKSCQAHFHFDPQCNACQRQAAPTTEKGGEG